MEKTQVFYSTFALRASVQKIGNLVSGLSVCWAGEEREFRGVLWMDEKARIL